MGVECARSNSGPDHRNITEMTAESVRASVIMGSVDVLINNAGSFNTIGPAWETDPESWWQDVTINIKGTHHCCRAVVPGMVSRTSGRVINLIGGGTGGPIPTTG